MSPFFIKYLSVRRGIIPRTSIQRGLQWIAVFVLVLSLFAAPVGYAQAATIPTFSIVSVVSDESVKIETYNFPAGQIFTVRMGEFGTLGIGGTVVGTTNSGSGGSFQETYDIPDGLQGDARIAIRMDSTAGYYAYNWFDNADGGDEPDPDVTPVPGGYKGIPSFDIKSVEAGETITILTKNFPASQNFTVRMGAYGTLGIGGVVVATTNSGSGGAFEETYDIPDSLKNKDKIAIRMDSPSGYYAYNWFWNTSGGGSDDPTPGPTAPVYYGIPSFKINAVVTDETVTILTHNFPKDLNFTVRMGAYGTLGVGGVVVATTNSEDGGAFEATYDIPDSLKGSQRIAIRMDSSAGYYAYNWFWNSSTSGSPAPTAEPGEPTTTPVPGYSGIPTFKVTTVAAGDKVTILTNNFPADQNFTVRMGAYGTAGVGGVVVATTNSGAGGAFEATYDIPDSLSGAQRIAIRLESSSGYYAFNWFWNQ